MMTGLYRVALGEPPPRCEKRGVRLMAGLVKQPCDEEVELRSWASFLCRCLASSDPL